MKSSGTSFQGTISIFSPNSSSRMLLTREPRTPTQAPTQSTLASVLDTAILVRWPGSRAISKTSMVLSLISGTSISKSALTKRGSRRLRMIFTWLPFFCTSRM